MAIAPTKASGDLLEAAEHLIDGYLLMSRFRGARIPVGFSGGFLTFPIDEVTFKSELRQKYTNLGWSFVEWVENKTTGECIIEFRM